MPLFQKNILQKYSEALDSSLIDEKWNLFKAHFQDPVVQQNIRNSKEEQYQEGFVNDLFVKVLGYVKNPAPNYNFITEQKNEGDNKKADGAIIFGEKVRAVVELKGCDTTDLGGKVETQAFGYKNRQANCKYVVTSNFEKLRFYIHNAIEHIEFNLFELSREEFEILWLCLAYENLEKDLPISIKNESVSSEDQITKELYKEYSQFKRDLFNDLVRQNPQFDKLLLFKKTQKLIDRFLFVLFAEDRLLLPANFIVKINAEWKQLQEMRVQQSLFDRYKLYFEDLNVGNPKQEIFAYNGGLFQPDEVLEQLKVDDALLFLHTNKLSSYDFESEVDVNILGHIFENSLNEIEEIQNELLEEKTGSSPLGRSGGATKRKKDGVFYTPKYITKYIVENTIGNLCEEKKAALEITDEFYNNAKKRSRKRLENLQKYRNWLLQLKICDPACGSGAFLNQALEFLIAEHHYLDELSAKYNNDPLVLSDVENSILENNLYGVDINEESVHIAKLSLWLRTARRNRKLNNLNQNIKCGNSLIADPEIAGEKAFDWEKEFPEVFDKGGFDVVIGNPPYLRIQGLKDAYPKLTNFYENKFSSATGNYDIYVLFMEKSVELINPKGLVSFILPHKFLISEFGEGIRKFISENKLMNSLLHFEENLVFEVTTYTCILTLNRKEKETIKFKHISPNQIMEPFYWDEMNSKDLGLKPWNLQSNQIKSVFNKLNSQKKILGNFINIFSGIQTSGDSIYILEKIKEENDIFTVYSHALKKQIRIEKGILKPIIKGSDIKRYADLNSNNFVIFPYQIIENKVSFIDEKKMENEFPLCLKYLKENEENLRGREKGKMNHSEWYAYVYPKNLILSNNLKLVSPDITYGLNTTKDGLPFCLKNGAYGIEILNDFLSFEDFFLCLLNSKLLWFYLKNTGNVLRGGYFRFNTKYISPFPLPEIPENTEEFTQKADKMLLLNSELQHVLNKFTTYFSGQYTLEKLSRKLENWHELEFPEFISELNKNLKKQKSTTLNKKEAFEWMDLFAENKAKAQNLQTQIAQTDREIDQMVYALYDLNEEEIAIVENS